MPKMTNREKMRENERSFEIGRKASPRRAVDAEEGEKFCKIFTRESVKGIQKSCTTLRRTFRIHHIERTMELYSTSMIMTQETPAW